MDSGELNKIAGGVIGALLVFMLVGFFSRLIYFGPEHVGEEEHVLAFAVEVAGDEAEEDEEIVDFAGLLAEADPGAGESQFNKCRACHSLEEGNHGVGPSLWDVVGREIASIEAFNYSDALAQLDGSWDMENLFGFIHDPTGWAPGTKMTFAGVPNDQDKMNLIAFLNEQADEVTPLTAPEPTVTQLEEEEVAQGVEVGTEAEVPVVEEPRVPVVSDEPDPSVGQEPPLPRVERVEEQAEEAGEELIGSEDNTATFTEQTTVSEDVPGAEQPGEEMPVEEAPGAEAPVDPDAAAEDQVETEARVLEERTTGSTIITEEDRTEPIPGTPATEEVPEESAEAIEDTAEPAEEGEAAVAEEEAPTADLLADADVGAGESLFRRCQACHSLEDGQNRVGPHLHGVLGREIAGVEGYSYSDALANKEGAWDVSALSAFLADPSEWAPGTKMAFPGIDDEQDRLNLIAFVAEATGGPAEGAEDNQ